jgi:phosphopantothenoylcysteine decarboxylase/phosphopantothenate--cysteine ligase
MGHIRLTREADIVIVAPASADLIAKMAHGMADDLATATLLANNKPLYVAPAMNPHMWAHPATQRNLAQIKQDGALIIEPESGEMACGEIGAGRMAEVQTILEALGADHTNQPLKGARALVTSGPTQEPIDPVRYITNRSSGKQGHAIAAALAKAGAQVTLVSGPTGLPDPSGVQVIHVESADEMLAACEQSLPADIAVCAAAVADWRVSKPSAQKLKKAASGDVPALHLIENPDILAHIAAHPKHRPGLVIGFAAETEMVEQNAQGKLKRKGCDWIVANDVSSDQTFGKEDNQITLIKKDGEERWERMSKSQIAQKLVEEIVKNRSTK